ncbi:NAD-dependent epimerase/dehydratase family protein [Zeaxanthinibacter enoshimensis]|uniref:NAD-dependent epimerase/dehydratase family protein n=1 Tax=Zeaxanthinibacter enoshimensis TaxID=392009 RepID=UPI003563143D
MIFVTGGTGLVGSHLLLHLLTKGMGVRALYREPESLQQVYNTWEYYGHSPEELMKDLHWVKGDLMDIPSLEMALQGIETVYHCAALVSFDPGDYLALRRANITGTANLVNVCLAMGVKQLCYVSSIATIGSPLDTRMANEEDELLTPVNNVYALTKHGAEMEVWRGSQEGLAVVIVNPGLIIGPGSWDRSSGRLFGIAGKGSALYPPGGTGVIGVNDVAKIMIALMQRKERNQRYILVAENISYKQLLEKVSTALGHRPPRKKIPLWVLKIAWRLDWFRAKFTGAGRKLTRDRVASLDKQVLYDNTKITALLNYTYESLDSVITFSTEKYLEDRK